MLPHLSRGQLLCSYGRSLSSAAALDSIYDVAIIGGGMVGSALACALGETYLRQMPAFISLLEHALIICPDCLAWGSSPRKMHTDVLHSARCKQQS